MILILSNFFYLNVKGLGFFKNLFTQTNKYFPESKLNFTLSAAHKGKREKTTWSQDKKMLFFFFYPVVWLWCRNVQSAIRTGRCTTFVCKTDLIIPTVGVGWPKIFGMLTVSGLPVESSVYLAWTEQAVMWLSWDPGSLKQGNSWHVLTIAFWH